MSKKIIKERYEWECLVDANARYIKDIKDKYNALRVLYTIQIRKGCVNIKKSIGGFRKAIDTIATVNYASLKDESFVIEYTYNPVDAIKIRRLVDNFLYIQRGVITRMRTPTKLVLVWRKK